jgi:hypothetical protein
MTITQSSETSDLAIFDRLVNGHKPDMSAVLARYVLTLGFDESEQARMRQLAERNQDGQLTSAEHDELMGYVKAGHLLALLHSKARMALKKRKVS